MRHQPSIVLAFVSVLFLLSIKPYEACRSAPRDDGGAWMREKHLLLPSLPWKPVPPPAKNPGTNSVATLGEKNFAAATPEHVLLPSLLWNPVSPPAPNAGTNNIVNSADHGEKNYVASKQKKPTNLLLPSLQWRPVPPPSTNTGHNGVRTASEHNFSGGKMAVRPPPLKQHRQQLPAVSHI